jgi:hypothetical protein
VNWLLFVESINNLVAFISALNAHVVDVYSYYENGKKQSIILKCHIELNLLFGLSIDVLNIFLWELTNTYLSYAFLLKIKE